MLVESSGESFEMMLPALDLSPNDRACHRCCGFVDRCDVCVGSDRFEVIDGLNFRVDPCSGELLHPSDELSGPMDDECDEMDVKEKAAENRWLGSAEGN